MIDILFEKVLNANQLLPLLASLMFAAKILLFATNKRRTWKIHNLIYFNNKHLILSHSQKSYQSKVIQNELTIAICALLMIYEYLNFMSLQLNLN